MSNKSIFLHVRLVTLEKIGKVEKGTLMVYAMRLKQSE